MKWSIVLLIIIGVLAAGAASLLIGSLGARSGQDRTVQDREVTVLMAARDLPAASIVDSDSVIAKKLNVGSAPPGYLSDPSQVVGRVIRIGVLEGQPFSKRVFASGKSGVSLAAVVPDGMRAVTISLSDYGGMEGLLYPGSVVDVLASFKAPSEDGQSEELVSLPLLQNVQVLAVEDQTVVSETEEPVAPADLAGRSGRRRLVTLMVTSKQASMLQLAGQSGNLSLAMRNPLDKTRPETSPTRLRQISELFAQTLDYSAVPVIEAAPSNAAPAPRQWVTVIYRGGVPEVQSLPMPAQNTASP